MEERAHARLQQALQTGDQFKIKAAQEFYLRASETLRRLDLAVESEQRKLDETISKEVVEGVSKQISGWLRIAFDEFLASEALTLMGIRNLGEFKFFAAGRFKTILHSEVKRSLKADSVFLSWAADQVRESWNIH
jgi:hypothetical protein